jgi:hypothetical protein
LQEQATLLLDTLYTADYLLEMLSATFPTAARNVFYALGRGGFCCMRLSEWRSIAPYRRNYDSWERHSGESFLSAF